MTFIVTDCPVHGSTQTADEASARVYGEVARACVAERTETAHVFWHAHEGTSCWACCDLMWVIPA